jgi:Zn-dependent protease
MDSLSLPNLRDALVYLVALVLSICVHEFGHAFVADKLGDRLPRAQGRVTLNPLAHIDPIGTILFPLIGFFAGPGIGSRILGWGRPVQISLRSNEITKKVSLRTAHALVAIAGPLMNILFALVLSGVFVLLARSGKEDLAVAVAQVVVMNIGLAFFNLIPCPPLDGGAILAWLLPRGAEGFMNFVNRYGFIIFFGLLITGLLSYLMIPAMIVARAWLHVLAGLAS